MSDPYWNSRSSGEHDYLLFEYDREIPDDPLSEREVQGSLSPEVEFPQLTERGSVETDQNLDDMEHLKRKAVDDQVTSLRTTPPKRPRIEPMFVSEELPCGLDENNISARACPSTDHHISVEQENINIFVSPTTEISDEARALDGEKQKTRLPTTEDEEFKDNPVNNNEATSSQRAGRVSCTVPNCNMDFSARNNMMRHRRTKHGFVFVCRRVGCLEGFSSRVDYNLHSILAHKIHDTIICGIDGCNSTYESNWSLHMHREAKHPASFQCFYQDCSAALESDAKRARHVTSEHGVLPDFHCQLCGASFSNAKGANTHMGKAHSPRIEFLEK